MSPSLLEPEVLQLLAFYRTRQAGRPRVFPREYSLPMLVPDRELRAPAADGTACRCCGVNPANRPRGLCRACYDEPGLREQFPFTSKYAGRGMRDGNRGYRPPPFPTSAPPGTAAKVEILVERARLGVSLWHIGDAPLDPVDEPLDAT